MSQNWRFKFSLFLQFISESKNKSFFFVYVWKTKLAKDLKRLGAFNSQCTMTDVLIITVNKLILHWFAAMHLTVTTYYIDTVCGLMQLWHKMN